MLAAYAFYEWDRCLYLLNVCTYLFCGLAFSGLPLDGLVRHQEDADKAGAATGG